MPVLSTNEVAAPAEAAGPPAAALLGAWTGSAALVYCRDERGRILAANPAFARKFGRSPADMEERLIGEYLHPDDSPTLAATAAELRQPPHRAVCESRWLTPQGWRWISWEEHLLAPAPAVVRAVGHDITRQRMAEEQYFKLSRAVEQSPVAMAITDAEGTVQYVNPKFIDATGYSLERIIEDNIQVLREVHPDDASYARFWETIHSGREWRGEYIHQRPDGRKIWESVQVSCLRNSTGEITNLLCLREDITERRQLEDQLRQAQKMESLGTLAGGISHDFNNMLAIINGYSELALMKLGDAKAVQHSLQEIKRAGQRAAGLIRQILTFSRKAEVKFSSVDLNNLARELVALLAETFPRNVSLTLVPDERLQPLNADQNQLQQIILNLCVNARDAMPGGGAITLSTGLADPQLLPANLPRDRTYACLTVADNGSGMTPEIRARIFEPFFTTKAVNQGTGLGLAVVYGIAASHGGAITVDSEPGRGSTFRVYLPLAQQATAATDAAPVREFPRGTESILVVDDENALRQLLISALSRNGFRATGAADGLDAIDQLTAPTKPFDVVLLDLNMPGADGLAVYKIIKATRPDLRVLVLSGNLTPQARAEFEKLGQRHFVHKPYTLDDLGRGLREVLAAGPDRVR